MLLLMSGSSAAGKTAVGPHVARLDERLIFHDSDERRASGVRGRIDTLESWIETALDYRRDGRDLLLGAQSPLGELLACPSATELDGIAGCVLDCNDYVRADRIRARGEAHAKILGMDIMSWGVFHRMHAADPQWEQRVICKSEDSTRQWSRWTSWTSDDPRWRVPVFDTSDETVEETAGRVAAWAASCRVDPPLSSASLWWTDST